LSAREKAAKAGHRTLITLFSLFAAFPFAWMLITTFKKTNDLLNPNSFPFGYPKGPTLENLRVLFEETLFVRWIGNTLFVGVIVVIITLLLAVPAGYALARLSAPSASSSASASSSPTWCRPPSSSSRSRRW